MTVENLNPLVQHNFNQVVACAQAAGIKRMRIMYEGSGDSGGIDNIDCDQEHAEKLDALTVSVQKISHTFNQETNTRSEEVLVVEMSLRNAFQELFDDMSSAYCIDFNGEGCNGTFEIDVDEKVIEVENNYPVYHTESYRTKY